MARPASTSFHHPAIRHGGLVQPPCVAAERLATFIRHRIVRIVPLYWLLTTVKLVLVFLFADTGASIRSRRRHIARSYLFFPVVDGAGHFRPLLPVGWTLTYEFLFYLSLRWHWRYASTCCVVLVPGLGLLVVTALLRTKLAGVDHLVQYHRHRIHLRVVLAKLILGGCSYRPALRQVFVVAGFVLILAVPEGFGKSGR